MEHKNVSFEMKAVSDDGSTGEGLASFFHNIDSSGEIVAPGFFNDDLPRFLSEGFVGGINHDWNTPIGTPTKAEETELGLSVGWKISATTAGKDVMILLKDKVIKKLSIGYQVTGYEFLETVEDVTAYWEKAGYTPSAQDLARASRGYVRLLTKGKLYEFSPVTVPANDRADITGVKNFSERFPTIRHYEKFLRDGGISKELATGLASVGYEGYKAAPERRDADNETANVNLQAEFALLCSDAQKLGIRL